MEQGEHDCTRTRGERRTHRVFEDRRDRDQVFLQQRERHQGIGCRLTQRASECCQRQVITQQRAVANHYVTLLQRAR
ncbi:MAG: hypothetical protein ACK559_32540 [bacterium]